MKPRAQSGIWDSSEQETLTAAKAAEKAQLKTCHGKCAGQAYSEHTWQRRFGYVL